jgi:hypothetical protein
MDQLAKLVNTTKDKETISTVTKLVKEYEAGFDKVCEQIKAGAVTTPQDANKAMGPYDYHPGSSIFNCGDNHQRNIKQYASNHRSGTADIPGGA